MLAARFSHSVPRGVGRLGLFGIGLDTYWPQFAGLEQRLKGYLSKVARKLSRPGVQVVNLGLVDTPEKAFAAINNVRGWWSEEIEGNTDRLSAVFHYHFQDVHRCTMKITEFVANKKVVWHVLDNYFSFTKDKTEWKDTDIIFEISKMGDKTEIRFTHLGLVPEYECYGVCKDAWSNYISNSLHSLIMTGKGQPNPKEGPGFNSMLAEKWNLQQ